MRISDTTAALLVAAEIVAFAWLMILISGIINSIQNLGIAVGLFFTMLVFGLAFMFWGIKAVYNLTKVKKE